MKVFIVISQSMDGETCIEGVFTGNSAASSRAAEVSLFHDLSTRIESYEVEE